MRISNFSERESWIHALDPRLRLITAFVFTVFLAWASSPCILAGALLLSLFLMNCAKIRLVEIAGRLAMLNLLVVMLLGAGWLLSDQHAGDIALIIFFRANTMLLLLTSLAGTMDVVNMGHALAHLRIPSRLALLFLFTIRHIDLLHEEFQRLRDSMRIRAFRPGVNLHTYKSLASLLGTLLVRSILRAEAIHSAMRCRCFSGRFYLVRHFEFRRTDTFFSLGMILTLTLLFWGELSWPKH
ncbi:MAG: hypothetical protein A2X49_11030 [Lentisphaerae bacterium GWF2_52_8]|nr:MAG: hypothetical protein A2X49_11030 [Lentisphaerae bacterium GWF2_52_8]